jgi:hypothetical protein
LLGIFVFFPPLRGKNNNSRILLPELPEFPYWLLGLSFFAGGVGRRPKRKIHYSFIIQSE